MANPTSAFGWQMPTSTDLVTDLPADFEVFGQAVDTSLADLKGGASGQILAKASNTDMDFTWVTNDVGDITAVTAGTGLTGGGTSGAVTLDFDVANFGGGQKAAAKNILINGLLDIWQRSTSVTFSGETLNAQDRWYNFATNSSTFARESSIVPTGCTYSCKVTIGASASAVQSSQVIETLNAAPYAGQTMTLSGSFQSSATPTITYVVYWSTATDVANGGAWTTLTATSGGSGTAGSSSFTRISGVYAIPATAKSLKVLWYSSSIASAGVLYWGGMQFEAGSVPTQVTRNASTIQGELDACQRYYEKSYDLATTPGTATFGASYDLYIGTAVTGAGDKFMYKVAKRTAPTVTIYSPSTGASGKIRSNQLASDLTVTQNTNGESNYSFYWTQTSANINVSYHWTSSAEL